MNNNPSFRVGDRVLCINGVPGNGTIAGAYTYPSGYVEANRVYTVKAVKHVLHSIGEVGGPIAIYEKLLLEGVPAISTVAWTGVNVGDDVGFCAARFQLV